MLSNAPRWVKVAGGIIGTLILGAIGSGLWDRLGDPIYVYCRDGLLNLATLGLTTLKDSLYADVAKGFHEHASTRLLTFALMAFISAAVFLALMGTFRYRDLRDRALGRQRSTDADQPLDVLEARVARARSSLRRALLISWMYALLVAVLFGFDIVKVSYTTRAIGHYQHLITLVSPFVTDDEIKRFNSRFAQIRSPQDYVNVTTELKSIAQKHQLIVPEFSPW